MSENIIKGGQLLSLTERAVRFDEAFRVARAAIQEAATQARGILSEVELCPDALPDSFSENAEAAWQMLGDMKSQLSMAPESYRMIGILRDMRFKHYKIERVSS